MTTRNPQLSPGPTLVLGATGKTGRRVAARHLEERHIKHSLNVIFLLLSGLLLLAIGGTILLVPHAFYASDGILLGHDPSLLSEIRAPGGLLASSGIVILSGAFRSKVRSLAIMLTVLVYGAFGLSRLVGLTLDGMPSRNLVLAAGVELAVAAIGLMILSRRSDAGAIAFPDKPGVG